MIKKQLRYADLDIKKNDFMFSAGAFPDDGSFESELEEVILSGKNWVEPQICIKIFDQVDVTTDTISINSIKFNCGKRIAKQFFYADKIIVFACTVGAKVTENYKLYMNENEPLKAYYTDTLGSVSVEKSMDVFQQQIREKMMEDDLRISNRYSPGYCGWLVVEQQKLFSLLPEKPCGISLTESSLMQPMKSISGIIGIGKNIKYTEHSCQMCDLEKCIYSRNFLSELRTN